MKTPEHWLQLGLGRAYGAGLDRDLLLRACREDWHYDRLAEEPRDWYLHHLIEASGEAAFYRDRLVAALEAGEGDETQVFSILRRFASSGDRDVRELLLSQFDLRGREDAPYNWAREIVELDGAAGLAFVLERWSRWFSQEQLVEERYWQIESLGELVSPDALAAHPAFARAVEQGLARQRTHGPSAPSPVDPAAIEAESDPERLRKMLGYFRRRPFPGPPRVLVALVDHADRRVSRTALAALEHVQHAEVRALALRLLEVPAFTGAAAGLLVRNGSAADAARVASALERLTELVDWHDAQGDVRRFVEAHPVPGMLERLYEAGPCSFCRVGVVRAMAELGELTGALRLECRHDAEPDVRGLTDSVFPLV